MASNAELSAKTQQRLIEAARTLFARDGYSATSTDAILELAGLRRGAMYHHFASKAALFEAVCQVLTANAAPKVEAAAEQATTALAALKLGTLAWVQFVLEPGVCQILLVDAPTVLGWNAWRVLDRPASQKALRAGLKHALACGEIEFEANLELLVVLINGALNSLALHVGTSKTPIPKQRWEKAVNALFDAMAKPGNPQTPRARKIASRFRV
jgi:AcrR family transcriptional regulator